MCSCLEVLWDRTRWVPTRGDIWLHSQLPSTRVYGDYQLIIAINWSILVNNRTRSAAECLVYSWFVHIFVLLKMGLYSGWKQCKLASSLIITNSNTNEIVSKINTHVENLTAPPSTTPAQIMPSSTLFTFEYNSTKYKVQNTKYKIQNVKYKIQNTKYKIQNTKYKNIKYKIQNTFLTQMQHTK